MSDKKHEHYDESHGNVGFDQMKKNQRIHARVVERLSHLRRKLSRGASNIYRMMRSRSAWGNKQLWGSREKGRQKPSDTKK